MWLSFGVGKPASRVGLHTLLPLSDSFIVNTTYFGVVQYLLISVNNIDMSYVLQGNKRGCDFNELIYDPMSHWPDELELLTLYNYIEETHFKTSYQFSDLRSYPRRGGGTITLHPCCCAGLFLSFAFD
jgi:hypothetical protein